MTEKARTRGSDYIPKLPKLDERRLDKLGLGQWVEGQVERIVDHGAWIDIGAQVAGFLHVRDIKNGFVQRPSDELTPGQKLKVCTRKPSSLVELTEMLCAQRCASSLWIPQIMSSGLR